MMFQKTLEKTLMVWRQSYFELIRTPLTIWLGLLVNHLRRFYAVFFLTPSWMPIALWIGLYWYLPTALVRDCGILFTSSLMVYLMRPTVTQKNFSYLYHYLSLDFFVPVALIIFFYCCLAWCLPESLIGAILVLALLTFSVLYDTDGSLPTKVGLALIRTLYLGLYQAPVVSLSMIFSVLVDRITPSFFGLILKITILYPVIVALVTIMYITAIHENYELYYAE